MSNAILIIGESGAGKSSAIRTLNPEETFIINVLGKPLPFRGYKKGYVAVREDGRRGNYFTSDNPTKIIETIHSVNKERPQVKHLVLDDFGYVMTNSFMNKSAQKGYDKFTEIGKQAYDILDCVSRLRDDLFCYIMMHTEIDQHGKYKPKTVGKMIDQYICIEGKFSYVFHALVSEGRYQFLTNNDGQHMAKTPIGMFDSHYIDNDLILIANNINDYNSSEFTKEN